MPANEPVGLHRAFRWDCPKCSRENFVHAVGYTIDPEREPEAFEACFGVAPDSFEGRQMIESGVGCEAERMPLRVTCEGCDQTFPTNVNVVDDESDD